MKVWQVLRLKVNISIHRGRLEERVILLSLSIDKIRVFLLQRMGKGFIQLI